MTHRESFKNRIVFCLPFALFFIWMAAQIPYTHDDWDWGLPVGISQWLNATVNSRYAGNLVEILMTRSELLKALILGTGCFLIPFLSATLSSGKKGSWQEAAGFGFACFLLLTMDRKIWRQTCSWVAGFANFGVSAIFLLLLIWAGLRVYEEEHLPGKEHPGKLILCFCVSCIGQLFLENIAVCMVVFWMYIGMVFWKKHRRIPLRCMILLAGAAAGLFLMFSSNIYRSLFSTGTAVDGYRRLNVQTGQGIWENLYSLAYQAAAIARRLYEDNLLISLSVLLLTGIGLLRTPNRSKSLILSGVMVNVLLGTYFLIHTLYDFPVRAVISLGIGILFFGVIAGETVLLLQHDRVKMAKLLTLWGAVCLVAAPLVVVSELGPRLFFSTNVLQIFFATQLLLHILETAGHTTRKRTAGILLSLAVLLVLGHIPIYSQIGACKTQREQIIAQAAASQAEVIYLPPYPHEEYLQYPDPVTELRTVYFKEFYGIGERVTVVFQDN